MAFASYKLTAILFGIGVTLHNLEEAIFLAKWGRTYVKLWFTPNPRIYWVLTSLVSAVIWAAVLGVNIWPDSTRLQCVLSGFALVMAINAVLPHLVISLVKHSYLPGLGTGMLFNLPLGMLLIHQQLSAGVISPENIWRLAVPDAVLFIIGAFGSLFGAHAILARKQ